MAIFLPKRERTNHCEKRRLSAEKPSKTGAVKAVFAIVQAYHPRTNRFSSAKVFCLMFIASTLVPAHGQTPCPDLPEKAQAINLTVNNGKTRFRLRNGVTSFVIPLVSAEHRFTLENESVAANGTFSIATASRRLAANDVNWNVVAGAVRFRQKRQFNLSLVGVDAKFVRLTFQVDRAGKITRAD